MAVRYEWGWDIDQLVLDGTAIGTLSCTVNDGTDSGTAEIATGTYCHTDITAVMGAGEYDDFAGALDAEIDTVLTTNGATVTWTGASQIYTLTFAANTTIDFRSGTLGDDSGKMLAAILGINYEHASATGGSASDPYNVQLSGATSYTSNCRPYFLIVPTIAGRSQMTDEYEEEAVGSEVTSDDGTAYVIAKDGAALFSDWIQMAETDAPPAAHTSDGVAVFKRSATAEVPWSYQHAWEHTRTLGSAPFLVADTGTSENAVHKLRLDGLSFKPSRFASQDFALWNIPFRTRLLGRL